MDLMAIHRQYINKVTFRGEDMTGCNPTDRSKRGTKRHILTDKNSIPFSAIISSASTHDIKAVTDVLDNAVIKRPTAVSSTFLSTTKQRKSPQHRCLDREHIILNQ
jgi:hypothetical protein